MATYAQWIKSCKLSQAAWIYGTEQILQEDVLSRLKIIIGAGEFNSYYFYADANTETEIWYQTRQRTISENSPKLIVVRDAEKLKDWENLREWLEDYRKSLPDTSLIFISNSDPSIPEIKAPKVTLIKCNNLKSADLVQWVGEKSGLSENSSRLLLDHTAGNLEDTMNICLKVSAIFPEAADLDLTLKVLKSLADETVSDFVDALISFDKVRAVTSLKLLTMEDRYKAVGSLDLRLTQLSKLQDLSVRKLSAKDLATIPGVPYNVVKDLLPTLKYYNSKRIAECRKYLALVDSYQQRGVEEGVLELAVANW